MKSATTTSTSSSGGPSSSSSSSQVAAHTHIAGLGLNDVGEVDTNDHSTSKCGLIGQVEAREAMGIVADLVKSQKLAGRGVLLTGPPGTGKTALAVALSKTIGTGVPFCPMVASAVYSKEVKKTEILTTHFRKAIGLRIRERKEVYEGEVTELTVQETEDPLANAASYGRTISHVVITLKTSKGTKTLKLDPILFDNLQKENVTVGDVIYIEANSGAVKRVGRSDTFATEFDLEAEEYVPVPKGDVHKKREIVQDVTVHDLDVANANPPNHGSAGAKNDVLTLLAGLTTKHKKTEITDKLRQEINKVVQRYIAEGIAELIPGVLFIDEVHMLDMECFTFLNRSLESSLSPIVVMATNRGVTSITGTTVTAPHGIPLDLLDRLLIIPTHPYSVPEMIDIISIRATIEKINFADTIALETLGNIAGQTSLRYALQLLMPAKFIAETSGRTSITVDDITTVGSLFVDGKASAEMLSDSTLNQGYMQ